MNGEEPAFRIIVETFAGPSPDLLVNRADVKDPGRCTIRHPEDLLDVFGHLPKLLLAFAKCLLCQFLFGQVEREADRPGSARLTRERSKTHQRRHPGAVFAKVLDLNSSGRSVCR